MSTDIMELNLDDEQEVEEFINNHGTRKGRLLANRLGLRGKGSTKLATALSNYVWNKHTAMALRRDGMIGTALEYEAICDSIYKDDLQGKVGW
jgi:hypothetical protein